MSPNKQTGQFELEHHEQIVLGEPAFASPVCFSEAPQLFSRAHDRLTENNHDFAMSEIANGSHPQDILRYTNTRNILRHIIRQTEPFIADQRG